MIFIFSAPIILKNLIENRLKLTLFVINIFFLTFLLIYSVLVKDNSLSLALRFYIIPILILASFFISQKKYFVNGFLTVVTLHALFLIFFELYLMFLAGPDFPRHIRNEVLTKGLGDIYTYDGFFYRIQVKGNAFLPLAFLVSLYSINKRNVKLIVASILLLATIIAGNFAFLIALLFYLFVHLTLYIYNKNKRYFNVFKNYIRDNRKKSVIIALIIVILLGISSVITFKYVEEVLIRKSEYSIPARIDQAEVLWNNLKESPTTILFGQGLGNIVETKTQFRDYSNYIYYELQSFYILNQVGIIYFLLFVITNIFYIYYSWNNKTVTIIYITYILYAFTNPYMFDTTNIIALIILNSLVKIQQKEGIRVHERG